MKKNRILLLISFLALLLNQVNAQQNIFRVLSFPGYTIHTANPIGVSPGGEYVVGAKWDDPNHGFIYDVAANQITQLNNVMDECTGATSS
jgi:hypothetical protein